MKIINSVVKWWDLTSKQVLVLTLSCKFSVFMINLEVKVQCTILSWLLGNVRWLNFFQWAKQCVLATMSSSNVVSSINIVNFLTVLGELLAHRWRSTWGWDWKNGSSYGQRSGDLLECKLLPCMYATCLFMHTVMGCQYNYLHTNLINKNIF